MMGGMPRKPVAREAVLDAFESLLIEVGERAATLDAVARRAGVSKGGLLYHFPTKEAMIAVLLERLDRLLAEDVAAMAAAPEGAAAYFIKSSVWADTPMDRVFVAATRLAEVAHEETLPPLRRRPGELAGTAGGRRRARHGEGRPVHGGRAVLQCHAGARSRRAAAGSRGGRREPPGRRRAPARLKPTTPPTLAADPLLPADFAGSVRVRRKVAATPGVSGEFAPPDSPPGGSWPVTWVRRREGVCGRAPGIGQ